MTFGFFEFMIAALATYRISLMVVREKGPGYIFKKTREAPSKRSKVYAWLTCIFCFSMTAAGLVCFGLWLAGLRLHYAQWLMLSFAMSAIAIMVHMKFKNEEP